MARWETIAAFPGKVCRWPLQIHSRAFSPPIHFSGSALQISSVPSLKNKLGNTLPCWPSINSSMRLWPYMSMTSSNYKGVQSHSTFHMFSFLHLTMSISQHKQDQILFPEHVGMLKEGGKERSWGWDPWDGSIHPDTLSWYPCLSKSHLPSPAPPPPPKSQRWIFPFWTTATVSTGALHSLFVVLNWRQFGPSGTSGKDWQSLDTFLVFIT